MLTITYWHSWKILENSLHILQRKNTAVSSRTLELTKIMTIQINHTRIMGLQLKGEECSKPIIKHDITDRTRDYRAYSKWQCTPCKRSLLVESLRLHVRIYVIIASTARSVVLSDNLQFIPPSSLTTIIMEALPNAFSLKNMSMGLEQDDDDIIPVFEMFGLCLGHLTTGEIKNFLTAKQRGQKNRKFKGQPINS